MFEKNNNSTYQHDNLSTDIDLELKNFFNGLKGGNNNTDLTKDEDTNNYEHMTGGVNINNFSDTSDFTVGMIGGNDNEHNLSETSDFGINMTGGRKDNEFSDTSDFEAGMVGGNNNLNYNFSDTSDYNLAMKGGEGNDDNEMENEEVNNHYFSDTSDFEIKMNGGNNYVFSETSDYNMDMVGGQNYNFSDTSDYNMDMVGGQNYNFSDTSDYNVDMVGGQNYNFSDTSDFDSNIIEHNNLYGGTRKKKVQMTGSAKGMGDVFKAVQVAVSKLTKHFNVTTDKKHFRKTALKYVFKIAKDIKEYKEMDGGALTKKLERIIDDRIETGKLKDVNDIMEDQ